MKNLKHTLLLGLTLLISVQCLAFGHVIAAATTSLTSSGSVSVGSNIVVYFRENSGSEPVNAARATITYPTDKLQFVSVNSSAAFAVVAASSGGGGTVNIDRGAMPAVSGSQIVASVVFKALKDSGTASVNLSSSSVISANSNSDIAAGGGGTNISLKPQPVAPIEPPKDTIPPTISKISVSDIKSGSVVINWTTSEPTAAEVNYGLTNAYGIAAVDTALVTDHKLTLNSPLLEPGRTYHYSIKSADSSGNQVTAKDASFALSGATLIVTLKDQKGKTLPSALVEFEDRKATTDKKGVATLTQLRLGRQTGVVTYKGDKYPVSVDIKSAEIPQKENLQITVKPNYTLPVILIVMLLLFVDFFIGRRTGRGGGKGYAIGGLHGLSQKTQSFMNPSPTTSGQPADKISPETVISPDKNNMK